MNYIPHLLRQSNKVSRPEASPDTTDISLRKLKVIEWLSVTLLFRSKRLAKKLKRGSVYYLAWYGILSSTSIEWKTRRKDSMELRVGRETAILLAMSRTVLS